jgi:hypothetical protein
VSDRSFAQAKRKAATGNHWSGRAHASPRGANRRRERVIQRRARRASRAVCLGRRGERIEDGLVPDSTPTPSRETLCRGVEHSPDDLRVDGVVSARESSLQKRGSIERTGRSTYCRDE